MNSRGTYLVIEIEPDEREPETLTTKTGLKRTTLYRYLPPRSSGLDKHTAKS